jgi:uncharacterized protein
MLRAAYRHRSSRSLNCRRGAIDPLGLAVEKRVANTYDHMYYFVVKFSWDEPKRQANLAKHGLDFADAEKVFAGPMVLFEDTRIDYGEQRMIGVGLLDYLVVLIVHVENEETIRIISMRKADGNETDIYYQNVGYF